MGPGSFGDRKGIKESSAGLIAGLCRKQIEQAHKQKPVCLNPLWATRISSSTPLRCVWCQDDR